jgi:hypothetical protein
VKIIAIDPGTSKSAFVIYDEGDGILSTGTATNEGLLIKLRENEEHCDLVVVEMIEGMGMAVGREVFETCVWIGRFIDSFEDGWHFEFVTRREEKLLLCGSMRAKDKNVRQALIDMHGARGTKKNPGPTYGVTGDAWSALAVATVWDERRKGRT